jgi:hypothetical protein
MTKSKCPMKSKFQNATFDIIAFDIHLEFVRLRRINIWAFDQVG